MIDIGIATVPNQTLSIQIDERAYDLTLRETNGCMSVTIVRDLVTLVTNLRVVAGTPMLPYKYQESGNFAMLVENEDLPYWDKFNVTQFLVYLSASEVAALRG